MLGAVTSDVPKGSAKNICSSLAEQGGVGINRQPKSDTWIQENPQITLEQLTFWYGFVICKISTWQWLNQATKKKSQNLS